MSTDAIDGKKNDTGEKEPDFQGFFKNYLSSIIFTIGFSIFIIGTFGLYTSKVAYADILPSDITIEPFTDHKRYATYKTIVDMMIMRKYPGSPDIQTMKGVFDYEKYLKDFEKGIVFKVLCFLKVYNLDNPDSITGSFADYLSDVYATIITNNFAIINSIFKFLYNFCPESMIMLLYGFLGTFLWISIYFINLILCIGYHIGYGFSFFKTWVKMKSPLEKGFSFPKLIEWFWYCAKVFGWGVLLLYLFFFLLVLSVIFFPIISTVIAFISPLAATYKCVNSEGVPIKDTKGDIKEYTVVDFIKDTFVYKKLFFFILATISLIGNGGKYLGVYALLGIFIAIIIAYFMGLYNNELPLTVKEGETESVADKIKTTGFSPGVSETPPEATTKAKPICRWKPAQKGASNQSSLTTLSKNVATDPGAKLQNATETNTVSEATLANTNTTPVSDATVSDATVTNTTNTTNVTNTTPVSDATVTNVSDANVSDPNVSDANTTNATPEKLIESAVPSNNNDINNTKSLINETPIPPNPNLEMTPVNETNGIEMKNLKNKNKNNNTTNIATLGGGAKRNNRLKKYNIRFV